MVLTMTRNLILLIGWPVLIAGSIYVFIRGRAVYKLVKGSLVGNITKVLVYTMLVEMYSLAIVCTAFMLSVEEGAYLVVPIFFVWFLVFVWFLRAFTEAEREARKIAGEASPQKSE